PRSGPPDGADDFELLAADLARAHDGAVTAVVQAAQLSSQAGSEQKLEVFVNLARRLQSLVHREISILDELENEIEDPDLLKGLFHVDHLATRIRRHAENLAVLGGAVSRRQWSNPVSMTEVLRSAIAEVEQYSRVKLVPPIDGTLRGHAVADVIHLLAELVENATVFSAPHTQVLLRANLVTSGLAVEVEDRGLGMPVAEQHRMNALLADPDQVNVASLLADGRIGLFVVSQLAKRHGIHVRLQTNIYGGVQAVLVVPQALLGSAPGAIGAQSPEAVGSGGGAGTAVSAQGPAHPRPGHEARHRGAPAEPRPGAGPRRGESRGTESGLNGSAASTTTSGGAVSQGARVVRNGRGPVRNGNGCAPSEGDRASTGGGSMADGAGSLTRGGGGVVADDGAGLDGVGGVSSRRGRGPGDRDPLPSGGAPFLNGGSEAPGGGEAWSDGNGSLARGVPERKPAGGGTGSNSGRPAPLPVRGARAERPTPAEAVPGIRPDDRRLVAEHVTAPPTPRTGTVRGTMGKPQLPRRRAQEHIAPQLRGGPVPRQDPEYPAGHDPGLMAAFQRGISLAEAQQHLEQAPGEPTTTLPSPRREADPVDPARVDAAHTVSAHMDPAHLGSAHADTATTRSTHADTTDTSYLDAAHTNTGSAASANPSASFDFGFDLDANHTDAAPIDVTPMDRPHISEAHGLDLDRTTPRHDGSAPAG
ncbi:ATP-binding protein, partial [Streptomyces canus]|uniref:ATP-binding protein n=1 Tax=Streptomyces canus TaxID=58343 RepID=UPI0033B00F21